MNHPAQPHPQCHPGAAASDAPTFVNPRQRGLTISYVVLAAVMTGTVAVTAMFVTGSAKWVLASTLIILLATFLFQLYLIRGYVKLTPEGIVVRELRRRILPWREIVELRTKPFLANTVVQVRLADGRKRNLVAPLRLRAKDSRRFYEGAALINHWWAYFRGW